MRLIESDTSHDPKDILNVINQLLSVSNVSDKKLDNWYSRSQIRSSVALFFELGLFQRKKSEWTKWHTNFFSKKIWWNKLLFILLSSHYANCDCDLWMLHLKKCHLLVEVLQRNMIVIICCWPTNLVHPFFPRWGYNNIFPCNQKIYEFDNLFYCSNSMNLFYSRNSS